MVEIRLTAPAAAFNTGCFSISRNFQWNGNGKTGKRAAGWLLIVMGLRS